MRATDGRLAAVQLAQQVPRHVHHRHHSRLLALRHLVRLLSFGGKAVKLSSDQNKRAMTQWTCGENGHEKWTYGAVEMSHLATKLNSMTSFLVDCLEDKIPSIDLRAIAAGRNGRKLSNL